MRGALPPLLVFGALAGLGALLFFSLTPTGQAVIKGAVAIAGDLFTIGKQIFSMFLMLFSTMVALTQISYSNIHTLPGLLLFIITLIFWAVAGIGIISVSTWILEKIKNILKPT